MKQKELKFDIEKINDMKKSLSDSADDLNTYKDKVIQSLDKLKKDWNTAAGKNFMQNVDTDWTKEVENNWCGRRTFRRSGYSICKSRRRGRQN